MRGLMEPGAGAASLVLLATVCLYACQAPLPAAHCGDGADCPNGFRCDEELGACVTTSTSPPAGARCGSAGIFVDDFEDEASRTPWAFCPDDGASALLQDGALAFVFDPGVSDRGGGNCTSFLAAALLDDRIWVEVPQAPGSAASTEAFFELDLDGDLIGISQHGGDLHFSMVTGVESRGGDIPYDAEAHRWWALSEAVGNVSFETSPDGQSWTAHDVLPTPAHAARARLRLGTWSNDMDAGPGPVVFDNLNVGHAPVSFCGTSSFQDTLNGPALHEEWVVTGEDCRSSFTAVGLELESPAAAGFRCALSPVSGYSLEDSEVIVEIPEGGQPDTDIGIRLWSPHGQAIGFAFYGEEVGAWVTEEEGGGTSYGFDGRSAELRWLRVREHDDVITFEGRVDSADEWSLLGSDEVEADFDRLQVRLELIDTSSPGDPPTQPVRAVFRNYNLP